MSRFGTAGFAAALSAAVLAAAAPAGAGEDFYFRAGVGLDGSRNTRFEDRDCASASPAALYGCAQGIDGAPLRSRGDFGKTESFELGVGYVVAPALRIEAFVEYRPDFAFDGRANFVQTAARQDVSADLSALSGMLAAYLDLSGVGLPRLGPLRPFVGAGAGLSRVEIEQTRMRFSRTTTVVPGERRVDFAWMLAAGFALPLGEKATLDLAWRYADFGEVETGRGRGRIVWRDGSREPLELDLAETRAELSGHGLRLSLRWSFK